MLETRPRGYSRYPGSRCATVSRSLDWSMLASVLPTLASSRRLSLLALKTVHKPYCTQNTPLLRRSRSCLTRNAGAVRTALCSASPKHPAARVQLRSAQASYPDARAKRCQSSNHALPQQLEQRLVDERRRGTSPQKKGAQEGHEEGEEAPGAAWKSTSDLRRDA